MKRFLTLLVALLVAVTVSGVAQESVLIDFSELTADWPADDPTDNERTLVDFGDLAGATFTEEERDLMKSSLAIENWDIELSSSSRTMQRVVDSQVRQATVREGATQFENEGVMGIRVSFPTESFNAWAMVQPPFEIPAFADLDELDGDGNLVVPDDEEGRGRKFDNYGVVKNIGTLRTVSMNVYGLNYPYRISLILQDENNNTKEVLMGTLEFDGWNELTWENPNYIQDVRNREVRQQPLYPRLSPMRKLVGIRIYRDGSQEGGDFVSYIKDINVTYDLATLDVERDIDDEAVWGILQEREQARRQAELRRLGNVQILRFLEQRRMYPGPENMQ